MNKFHVEYNNNIYYIIDGFKTYSKIEAIHLAKGNMDKIQFHWMEDVWDNVDWSIEPTKSWSELLKIRCQQIRDKYPYLALWYSSGYDSNTILRSFIANNILLDEILIFDKGDFFNDPEVAFAIEHAKFVKEKYYPNLFINIIRIDYKTVLDFYANVKDDWIYHPGSAFKITKTSRYFATNWMNDFIKPTRHIKGRANIMGVDKPKVLLRDKKWYAFMPDVSIDCIGSKQENFYFSGDLPQLHVKQTHMVINWFNSLENLTENLVHEVQGRPSERGTFYEYYDKWNVAMGRFPLQNSHLYTINGQMKNVHTNNETSLDNINLLNHIKNNDKQIFKIYNNGLIDARKFNNGKQAEQTIISKQYYVKNQASQA
jgi:hypothetical protein